MTTIINGSSPSITFSDSTTQSSGVNTTNPVFTGDASISGLTVGKGGGAVANNVAVGVSALTNNTSGAGNIGIGKQALTTNTTGSDNTAVGDGSQLGTTTGVRNVSAGSGTLYANTTGSYNVAMGAPEATNGYAALRFNTTGSNNTALGSGSLGSNTTASSNTAVGYQAGYGVTTGSSNIFLGYTAGNNVTTTANSMYLGYGTTASSATGLSAEFVIGINNAGKGSNTGFFSPNGGGVYQGNNSATWSVSSDRRLKKNIVDNTEGLSIISQICVRNFEYRTAEEVTELPAHTVIEKTGVQLGVIAQELQAVCSDCVKEESTGVMSVNQDNLTWHMVNAIKDLKALVDEQAAEITALKAKVGI